MSILIKLKIECPEEEVPNENGFIIAYSLNNFYLRNAVLEQIKEECVEALEKEVCLADWSDFDVEFYSLKQNWTDVGVLTGTAALWGKN